MIRMNGGFKTKEEQENEEEFREHLIEFRDQYVSVEAMEQSVKILDKLVFEHANNNKEIVFFKIKVIEKVKKLEG